MTTLTESPRTGEFLLSEAAGTRSRENGTLVSGQDLEDGTVLAEIVGGADDGKLTAYVPGAEDTDGPIPAAGILYGAVDASGGDKPCAYIARDAEVKGDFLVYGAEDTDGAEHGNTVTALKALGIIVR